MDKKEFISNNLHEKLCSELKELNYKGTIRYSGFVEPLIDKNIFNLISMARTYLPNVNIRWLPMRPFKFERLIKLFDCGLNRILISAYDGKDEAEKLESLCKTAKLNINQYSQTQVLF